MAGPYLSLKVGLGPAIKGAWGATVGRLWSFLGPRNSPVAERDALPYWQGFRVQTEQDMGCV